MKRLIFKQRSKDDLLGIFDYIASDSRDAAENFVEDLMATCELLRQQPELGMQRPNLAKYLRMFVHRKYCIYYQYEPDSDTVRIARVLHPALDVSQQSFD